MALKPMLCQMVEPMYSGRKYCASEVKFLSFPPVEGMMWFTTPVEENSTEMMHTRTTLDRK